VRTMTDDLPEELDRVPENTKLGDVLRRVLSGEMVAYHPRKGLLGVWAGGTGFNVYDPTQWPDHPDWQPEELDTGEVFHFNMLDPSRFEDPRENARETFEDLGFEVMYE